MRPTVAEPMRTKNNIPLPIECLILDNAPKKESFEHSRMHYHEYIELLYPLRGDYEVIINGEISPLPEHSMIIIDAMMPHSDRPIHKKDERHTMLCIKFIPQILFSSIQSVTEMEYTIPYVFQQMDGKHIFAKEILQQTCVPGEWERINKEAQEAAFGYELALRASTIQIFTWILRYWHEHSEHPELFTPGSNISQIIHSIHDYVENNYASATLAGAAKACGLSYSYFSRIFNQYMHMSFSDYLNLTRTNQAMRLLATTEMSITEIAYAVGFSSTSYLIQVFKKHKHTTPKQFRQMCASSISASC